MRDCAGIECLSGIPGSVGGTPVQNVGAYGQEVSETIREVEALDRRSLQMRTFTNAECGFGYRSSIFNTTERDRYIILRVYVFASTRWEANDPICRSAEGLRGCERRANIVSGACRGARDSSPQGDAHRPRR